MTALSLSLCSWKKTGYHSLFNMCIRYRTHFARSSDLNPNVKMQVCDRAREAGRTERGGPAHPADAGAGTLAEGDDGAALQPVHGRTRGRSLARDHSVSSICNAGLRVLCLLISFSPSSHPLFIYIPTPIHMLTTNQTREYVKIWPRNYHITISNDSSQ